MRLISLLALSLAATTVQAWGSGDKPKTTAPSVVEPVDAPAPVPEVFAHPEAEDFDEDDDWPVPVAVHTPAPSTPKVPPPPFEGIEYNFGQLKIRPSEYKPEAAFLVFIALYGLAAYFGAKRNSNRAVAWFDAHEAFFRTQFAAFGYGRDETVMPNGSDEYLGFASGRRGCEKLDITLTTDASHDLLVTAYRLVRQILDFNYDSGENKVVLDFTLREPVGTPGAKFCFAICNRSVLRTLRDSRWDLRTFTRTAEVGGLPSSLVVMSESTDITMALNSNTGLLPSISALSSLDGFESLVITDQTAYTPSESATALATSYHLILTLTLPPTGAPPTPSLILLATNTLDYLHSHRPLLNDSAVSKLRRRRAEVLGGLKDPEAFARKDRERDAVEEEKKWQKRMREEEGELNKEEKFKALKEEREKERKKGRKRA